jgi:hypothetical protein
MDGCTGHVVRVEAYKADIIWTFKAEGRWSFGEEPRSHYHLFCSEKDNHAGNRQRDSGQLKYWFRELPEPIKRMIARTQP